MEEKQAELIRIENPEECSIVERLNRFVVMIEITGSYHPAHITNTGRLSELLVRGRKAFCFRTRNTPKTDYRLFAIEERGLGALIDTQLQMKAFEGALERNLIPWLAGCRIVKRNAKLSISSRIDYLLGCHGRDVYFEVKSAVLRAGDYAMYPDCPSDRGRGHIKELSRYVEEGGGKGTLLFMAALPFVKAFKPNKAADPKLYDALKEANSSGVAIRALGLYYHPNDAFVHLYNPDLEITLP